MSVARLFGPRLAIVAALVMIAARGRHDPVFQPALRVEQAAEAHTQAAVIAASTVAGAGFRGP